MILLLQSSLIFLGWELAVIQLSSSIFYIFCSIKFTIMLQEHCCLLLFDTFCRWVPVDRCTFHYHLQLNWLHLNDKISFCFCLSQWVQYYFPLNISLLIFDPMPLNTYSLFRSLQRSNLIILSFVVLFLCRFLSYLILIRLLFLLMFSIAYMIYNNKNFIKLFWSFDVDMEILLPYCITVFSQLLINLFLFLK